MQKQPILDDKPLTGKDLRRAVKRLGAQKPKEKPYFVVIEKVIYEK